MSIDIALREIVRDEARRVLREELRAALSDAARPPTLDPVEFLTTKEAAELAGVRPAAVRAWIGKGLRVHHAGRELRIARQDLLAFMAAPANSDAFDVNARAREIVAGPVRGRR